MELTDYEKDAIRHAVVDGLTGEGLLHAVLSGKYKIEPTGKQSFVLRKVDNKSKD